VAASGDPQVVAYGKKVEFRRNHAIRFPDFRLTFLRQRHVPSSVFPRGFVYYDFQAASGGETVEVSWSEGTGDIAPMRFKVSGAAFLLELKESEAAGRLKDGELVVRRQRWNGSGGGAAEQADEADEAFGGMVAGLDMPPHARASPEPRAPLRSLSPVFGDKCEAFAMQSERGIE